MDLNLKAILKTISLVTVLTGTLMLIPVSLSLIYHELDVTRVFSVSACIYIITGGVIFFAAKGKRRPLKARDRILSVNLIWITAIILSSVPLHFATGMSLTDAVFESTSGFTTTGASVMLNLESIPESLLFWRSLTGWIGGLGILVIFISVIPMTGGGNQAISKSDSIRSRKYYRVFFIYFLLTLGCIIFLLPTNMNLFEAVNTSLSTVSTGGFTVFDKNLTGDISKYTLWVLSIFMILGSINFTSYFDLFSSRFKEVIKDLELHWYGLIILIGSVLITGNILLNDKTDGFIDAVTRGVFSFVSMVSTTGFVSDNYSKWPTFSVMILFIALFIGGCSASAAGGIKIYRVVIIYKLIKLNLSRRLHPTAVVAIKDEEGPMRTDFVSAVAAFIFLYIFIIFTGTLVLSAANQDLYSTLSAVVSCLGNVGSGFDAAGPLGSYNIFPGWGKLLLCFIMIAGRLELFGFVLMTTRWFWKPDRYSA